MMRKIMAMSAIGMSLALTGCDTKRAGNAIDAAASNITTTESIAADNMAANATAESASAPGELTDEADGTAGGNATDLGVTDHGVTDHGVTDHGVTDHGVTGH